MGSKDAKMIGEEKKEEEKSDYSLLDELTAFLYSKEEPLPVLCGYFEKIFLKLMHQQKDVMKKYFFLEGKGKIFDAIIQKLHNHSISMIL